LKPIDIEELKRSLSKLEKKMGNSITERLQQLMQNMRSDSAGNFKLALPTMDGLIFVKVKNVLYCEASSNYTEITMEDNKKYIVSRTFKRIRRLTG
jgi:two-component system LytT family response regulator